ncbi:unnamed protein product [[Actinomadura] parvosata subsp. kistnae]|nr:unnamed protein product [Actinomadura parvosata subsp. kistnae]
MRLDTARQAADVAAEPHPPAASRIAPVASAAACVSRRPR